MTPPSSSGPDARSHLQYIPEPIPIQPRPPGCITNVPIDTTVPAPRGPSLSSVPPAGPLPASGIDQSPTSVSGIQGVQDPIQLVDAVDEDYEKPKASGGLQAPALQVTGATQVSQQDVAPIAEDAPRRSFSGPHPPPFSFRSSSQLDQASLPAAPLPIKRARQAPTDVQTDQLDVSDFEGDEDDAGADADSSAPSSRRHSTADGLAASFSSLHPTQGTAQAPHPSRASFGQAAAHSTSPAVGLGSLLKRVRAQREAAEAAASESWIEEEGRDHGEKQQTRNSTLLRQDREPQQRKQSTAAANSAVGERSKMSPSPKRDDEARKERGFGHRSTSSSGGLSAPRHGLNALSPLQHFSPLNAPSPPARQRPKVATSDLVYNEPAIMTGGGIPNSASMPGLHSASLSNVPGSPGRQHMRNISASGALPDTPGSQGRRSRAASVTSKLSRRDSLIARGEGGLTMTSSSYAGSEPGGLALSGLPSPMLGPTGEGRTPYTPGGSPGGLISRLTLVKAPNKGQKDKENETAPLKQRTRSSGNLAPLSESAALSSSFGSTATSMSSMKPRTPRSFSLVGDYGPAAPGGRDSAPGRRLSFLFGNTALNQSNNPSNIHEGPKALSPHQVVDMADSLRSPILAHDTFDDDAPPTSLSRSSSYRKPRSATTFSAAKQSEYTLQQQQQDEKDRLAEQLELEPVDYVEMHDDVLLPYVERPAEVAELFEVPYNAELLDIIKPTFPTESQADPSMPSSWRLVDPAKWTWDEFKQHVALDRGDCDDATWVKRFRQAVRARSEAMWEKIGVCLGCDADLLNIGDVPDALATGRAMTDVFDTDDEMSTPALFLSDDPIGFEGDDDGRDNVYIEPLAPADGSDEEASDDGRSSRSSVPGTPLSESHLGGRSMSPLPGASGAMETIGEEGASGNSTDRGSKPTPSQVAGGRGPAADPIMDTSPFAPRKISLPEDPLSPTRSHRRELSDASSRFRAKSFVGLQITTLPSLPQSAGQQQRSGSFFPAVDHPHFERGPGSPLFPTSFSSLSLAPTLPNNNPNLKMSSRMSFSGFGGALSGTGGAARQNIRATTASGIGGRPWMELSRKKSTGGMSRMSDSALTLGSEFGEEVGPVA